MAFLFPQKPAAPAPEASAPIDPAQVDAAVRTILDRANVADLRLEDPSLEELVAGFYEGPR